VFQLSAKFRQGCGENEQCKAAKKLLDIRQTLSTCGLKLTLLKCSPSSYKTSIMTPHVVGYKSGSEVQKINVGIAKNMQTFQKLEVDKVTKSLSEHDEN